MTPDQFSDAPAGASDDPAGAPLPLLPGHVPTPVGAPCSARAVVDPRSRAPLACGRGSLFSDPAPSLWRRTWTVVLVLAVIALLSAVLAAAFFALLGLCAEVAG